MAAVFPLARLRGFERLGEIIEGVKFVDGIQQIDQEILSNQRVAV